MFDQRDQPDHDEPLDLQLARQALRESEARYRALVDASPAGILVLQDGRWVFANPFVLRELGLSSLEELKGRQVLDIVHPESHAAVLERWRRLDQGEGNPPLEILIRRADGSAAVAETVSVPIEHEGRPAALVTVRNVSAERQARREREITLELLRLLNLPGDVQDLARSVTRFLRQACACDAVRFQWREGDRVRCVESRKGETEPPGGDQSVADPADAPQHRADALYRSGATIPLRHGSQVLGLIQLNAEAAGHFTPEWVAFLENVAGQLALAVAQREGQAALAANERRLRRQAQAIAQAAEGIVITGVDGAIEYVNPAFERATGYSAAEVAGQNPKMLKSGRHDQAFYKNLWDTVLAGSVWSGRVVNRRKDGTLYTEDSTIAPVKDEHGRIERFVAVKRDVSHEIELEAQFRQAQKLESVGRLAAGVAHDLNNLLLPILGYSELLMAGDAGHRQPGSPVDEIRQAAERSRELIRQLLAFARKQVLETRLVDLRSVVGGMEPLVRRTLTENVDLRVRLAPDPVPTVVDKGQIEQVLMNLVVNAHDAMPHGGILAVAVDCVSVGPDDVSDPDLESGEYARLSVTDNGVGMATEVRAHIFEPFYTTKGTLGTGLGLATVYGIVRQHGGAISVESAVGEGATFRVFLPAARQQPAAGQTTEVPGPARGTGTILVVEDSEPVRRLTCTILSQHGYQVQAAGSGRAAVDIAAGEGPIDLLLTDVVMPDMNGRELYRRLLKLRPDLRAVFMSGYAPDFVPGDERDRVDFFLRKPFTVAELTAKIREALDSAIME